MNSFVPVDGTRTEIAFLSFESGVLFFFSRESFLWLEHLRKQCLMRLARHHL